MDDNNKEIALDIMTEKELETGLKKHKRINFSIFIFLSLCFFVSGSLLVYYTLEGLETGIVGTTIACLFSIFCLIAYIDFLQKIKEDYQTLSFLETKELMDKIEDYPELHNKTINLYKKQGFIAVKQEDKIREMHLKEKYKEKQRQAEKEMKNILSS